MRSVRGLAVAAALLAGAGCGADGKTLRDPVFDLPAPPTSTTTTVPFPTFAPNPPPQPSTTPTTAPTTTTQREIVIDELTSPENATALVTGRGAVSTDLITVDGEPADVLSFDDDGVGNFVARVWVPDEGAHTVCVVDTCGRVFTLAPDAETPEEVIATIESAIAVVEQDYDVMAEFPDWTVEIGGALSGTGGTTDAETKTITIYRNRGRSSDDFVRTILHEYGHAADADRLDDDERATYRAIRGISPDREWRDLGSHRLETWAQQPSEDFAEVMTMIWSAGRWTPRTESLAALPDTEQLAAVAALVEP